MFLTDVASRSINPRYSRGFKMTVDELIKNLQQFRPDAVIQVEISEHDGIGIEHASYVELFDVLQYGNNTEPTVTIRGQQKACKRRTLK